MTLGGRLLRGGAALSIALALVVGRVLWSSRVEWSEAEARLAAGEHAAAIDHYGRAARLYAPGSPWSSRSLERLRELGEGGEANGNARARNEALSAWRELRSAILGTRSFYTPHPDLLADANRHIAALSAALEPPSIDPGADEAARTRWHAERLARDDAPSVPWTLAALAGLALWVGSAVGFLFRALDKEDRLVRAPALRWALGIAAGLALFILGLARA